MTWKPHPRETTMNNEATPIRYAVVNNHLGRVEAIRKTKRAARKAREKMTSHYGADGKYSVKALLPDGSLESAWSY